MDCRSCKGQSMKAAIDIGTNTVLLLVAEYNGKKLNVIEEQQRIPRLGRGVDEKRNLAPDSMQRVIRSLKAYKTLLHQKYSIRHPIVTATSAVRDAQNRSEFIEEVRRQTGFTVTVLSGAEEAKYTFWGAQSVFSSTDQACFALDIGGGSTEIATGRAGSLVDRHSFNMGCVRFTERFLGSGKPSRDNISACKRSIQEQLGGYSFVKESNSRLIGVAGTVTSLASINQGLAEYDPASIDGYQLSLEDIQSFIESFLVLLSAEIDQWTL